MIILVISYVYGSNNWPGTVYLPNETKPLTEAMQMKTHG